MSFLKWELKNFGHLVVQLHTFEIKRKSRIDFWSHKHFKTFFPFSIYVSVPVCYDQMLVKIFLLGFQWQMLRPGQFKFMSTVLFYIEAALTISQQAGKMHRPFSCFSNQTNKKILHIRSNSFTLKLLSNFSFHNTCLPFHSVYDQMLVEFCCLVFNDRC